MRTVTDTSQVRLLQENKESEKDSPELVEQKKTADADKQQALELDMVKFKLLEAKIKEGTASKDEEEEYK